MRYYHVWFQTKKKKYILVDDIDIEALRLFDQIAAEKGYDLLAKGNLLDHAHLLIALSEDQNLPTAIKMFKGISARKIFQQFSLLKQQIKSNNFWARNYGYKEVSEENLPQVVQYIENQKKDYYLL